MKILLALVKAFELFVTVLRDWRNAKNTARQRRLESDANAYAKLKKAYRARFKNNRSRRSNISAARNERSSVRLRADKYQRD